MEKLETTFFYNLEKTVKIYRQFFQKQLRINGFEITLDQWLTLKMIKEFPHASQNEIAERVFKDKASITRIVELLVKNGYLTKAQDPLHVKKSKFELTVKGEDTLLKLNNLVPNIRSIALGKVSDKRIGDSLMLLSKVQENCQKKMC